MEGDNSTKTQKELINKGPWGINRYLVMLKLTLFFLHGATSSLIPYLTIHMQSIGLTIYEIATIYLLLPFTTFLSPPLSGFLVDKFGRYKPVVIISFLLNAAIHHSFLLIPYQELPGVKPFGYVMRPPDGNVEVWWSPCPTRQCPIDEELDIVLDMCMDHCLLRDANLIADVTLNKIHDDNDLGDEDDLFSYIDKKKKNATKLSNPQTMVSNNSSLGTEIIEKFQNATAILFVLDMHPDPSGPESDEYDDSVDFKKRFSERLLSKNGVNVTELNEADLRCGGVVIFTNYTSTERMHELPDSCHLQKCNFRSGGPDVCPSDYKESEDSIFYIYFVLRFLGMVMMIAGVIIMDSVALKMVEKYGGDFGRQKLFSSLGMILFPPITGALIDYNSERSGYTDYSAAFYTYDTLLIVASITVFFMPIGTKIPANNMFRDLVHFLKMTHVIVFIIFLFLLGNLWGFIESFLFFYLKDLGAPNYLLGITITVGTISSMPFLYGAEKITKKLGHVNIIILAFFAYAGRLMGYSFIQNPWWCFPFEAMESISIHLMWVAAVTYCAILAPKHLLATLIGVIGMAHYSIGRGSGSFVGGHLISKVGIRKAFRLMGLGAVVVGLSYCILHYYWLRNIIPVTKQEDDVESGEVEKFLELESKFEDQPKMIVTESFTPVIDNPSSIPNELDEIKHATTIQHHKDSNKE